MATTIDKIIYNNSAALTTLIEAKDAASYNLKFENDIRNSWQQRKYLQLFIKFATFGIASLFLSELVTKDALEERITLFRNMSLTMQEKAKVIQRYAAKKLYASQRSVVASVQELQAPQFNSRLKTVASLSMAWLRQGPSLLTGYRGQIIWDRTRQLATKLQEQGYHVFLHSHSYPITLHHELAGHFQTMHQSAEFKAEKPQESQRKFRAPGVATHYANTTAYLASYLAKSINNGWSMDDNHRETIISCDALPDNYQAYESTHHFFHSNRSIVDTASSTGMSTSSFDAAFVKSFIQNSALRRYATALFAKARKELAGVADYGMIRVIAIKKATLENEETNYVWRSHAFGKLCTCKHTPGKFGHNEFVATLEAHQKGVYSPCKIGGSPLPQYRILASNLDKDPTKQIYNMDCLNSDERKRYFEILENLKSPLSKLIQLEQLEKSKTVHELKAIIEAIDRNEPSQDYQQGVREILNKHRSFLEQHNL